MKRRAVIVSVGVLSAVGADWGEFRERIFQARDWFRPLPADLPYPVGAFVDDKTLDDFYRGKRSRFKYRRYHNRAVDLGVAAAFECLDKAGLSGEWKEELSIFWGAGPNFDLSSAPRRTPGNGDGGGAPGRAGDAADAFGGASAAWILLYLPNMAASAISAALGSTGESLTYASACAAASHAIGEAFLKIRDGQLDMALCGGCDSRLSREALLAYKMLGALSSSPEPKVLPMCEGRDGFIPGEGAAAFLLMAEPLALSLGLPVLAEVAGYGASSDGFRLTDPEPNGLGMEKAMSRAIEAAGMTPGEIDVVNAHGTGTQMNDAAEAAAIRRVFGRAVPVTSNKSQLGHLAAASGAVELAACLAMLERNCVTPTANTQGRIAEEGMDLVRESRPLKIDAILSNTFGFGGQNSALVVRRPGAFPRNASPSGAERRGESSNG